ncbi:TPA: phosphohydrolase, partial [Candidatus Edwardsbacteria bacterium]|nr:phosphohydrolase [Candidatus Edwardsbacteria bacterium]
QAAIAIENIRLYNDLERSYYDTLKAFVAAMDAKDPYTKGHSENVRHYALKIARHIGLSEDKLRLVDYSSLLHDIGKLGIREDILAKPDVLSTAEFQEVKLHPVIGSRLVLEIDALSHTGEVIYCHHEYYDGSGYPRGIKGDDIPLEARIIAVADAFEAMTSDRPYRKAFSFQVALQRLQDAAGTQFDHKIVNAFTELFRRESGIKEGD